jgi:Domain of unknown function (DUF6265)
MNRHFARATRVTMVTLFLLLCPASSLPRTPATATIADLAWMAGSWQTDKSGRMVSDEHWAQPAGGIMIGMSRTIAGDKLASFESLRIEQRGEEIFYVASVKGRCPATDFKLTKLTGQEVVFENPEHDFPKRIIYRKKSATEMIASIDAGEGTKSLEYTFHSIATR